MQTLQKLYYTVPDQATSYQTICFHSILWVCAVYFIQCGTDQVLRFKEHRQNVAGVVTMEKSVVCEVMIRVMQLKSFALAGETYSVIYSSAIRRITAACFGFVA